MSLKKINQLFNFEKGVLQSSKNIEGEYDFITAAAEWKTHNEYSHDCEALIFAAAASGSLGRTHYVNGKFISSDLCFILTPKDSETLPVDLKFYHIIFNLYKNEIVAATKAGTSKEAIGLKVFGEYELPYFDITLQNKVKVEFGKADKLKNSLFDEYTYQLTQLENLNQAILQEAVQGKLVKQDPKDEPASELLKRIKSEKAKSGKKEKPLPPIKPEEIPFAIPESWVWCSFGELAELINGDRGKNYPNREEYVKNGVAWINTGHIEPDGTLTTKEMYFITEDKYNSLRGGKIQKDDLVYCLRGATFGKVAFVTPYNKGAIASSLMIIRLVELVDKKYVFYYLKSKLAYNQLRRFNNGSAQPNLAANDVRFYYFPLPPLSEQKRIVAEIEKQFAKTKQLKEHIIANQQATEQLLKALLHQAFEVREK